MIWEAIHTALSLASSDHDTAIAILDAADVTYPHSIGYIYDATGVLYQIPRYVLADPVEVLEDI